MDAVSSFSPERILYAVVSILAFPEWIIFTITYASNFFVVLKRPEKESSRLLALIMLLIYLMLRLIFPVFCLFAIPPSIAPVFTTFTNILLPYQRILFYIILAWWIITITFPAFAGLISWASHGAGNSHLSTSDLPSQPKFICILPVHNESLGPLLKTVTSFLATHYPNHLLEVHVAFDDEDKSPLYCGFVGSLSKKMDPFTLPRSWRHITSSGATVLVHRWPHGGKRSAQAFTYHFIKDCTNFSADTIVILTHTGNNFLSESLNNLSAKFYGNVFLLPKLFN